jgi:hypothetical protein
MPPTVVARSPLAAVLALLGGAVLVASLFIPWGRYASGEPVIPAAMLGASSPPASPATVIVIILAFLFGAGYWLPPLPLFLLASLPFVAPRALARRGPMAVVLAFILKQLARNRGWHRLCRVDRYACLFDRPERTTGAGGG